MQLPILLWLATCAGPVAPMGLPGPAGGFLGSCSLAVARGRVAGRSAIVPSHLPARTAGTPHVAALLRSACSARSSQAVQEPFFCRPSTPPKPVQGRAKDRCLARIIAVRFICFPTTTMKWISKLLGRNEPNVVCVKSITSDGLRLAVSEFQRPCGHPCYALELFVHDETANRWVPIGILHQDDVHTALALLMEGAKFIDRTVTERFQTELVDD